MSERPPRISTQFSKRASRIAVGGVLIGLFLMFSVEFIGSRVLEGRVSHIFQDETEALTVQHITHQLTATQGLLNNQLKSYLGEQAALASVLQEVQDHPEDFAPVLNAMAASPYFTDHLAFSGSWYQNSSSEQGTVLVQKYLLDSNNQIPARVSDSLKNSLILDWIGKPFYEAGTPKLWLFYTGGEDASYMRIYPWSNVGESLNAIYPEFTTQENWEAFNPGLIANWKDMLRRSPEIRNHLSQLAVIKPPTQDGGTGRIIMTFNHPIFDQTRSKITGSLNLDVELSHWGNLIREMHVGSEGFAYLSNSNGTLLAVPTEGLRKLGLPDISKSINPGDGSGYNWADISFSRSTFPEVRSITMPKDANPFHDLITINGKRYFHFQSNLNGFNGWTPERGIYRETWTLGYLIPYEDLMRPYSDSMSIYRDGARTTLIALAGVMLLFMLFLSMLILWLNKQNLRNLRQLTDAAVNISQGNLHFNIEVKGDDEIGQLAQSFRAMQKEVEHRINELNERNELLRQEISTRELREQQLVYLKQYDIMTNLPNQSMLMDKLDEWMESSDPSQSHGSVILLGLDDFRRINETFSHRGGDSLLNHVAQRLMNLRNQYSFICRMGGDEFALVYHLGNRTDDLRIKAEEILSVFEKPFIQENTEVFLSACMGICSYPMDGTDPDELLRNAATALNSAKETSKGSYSYYDAAMDESSRKKRKLANALRKAIDQNEMRLVYQPIVRISDNQLVGFEALIRWHHPEMGVIMPSTFIPLAEETGLIVTMGNWVLYEACRQLKEWVTRFHVELTVSVNISSLQFRLPDFVDTVKEMILITGLPPHLLNLELTEGLLIEDIPRVREMLTQLRNYGVEISIDDFGTGYSSLNYIRDFPVNKLKIDRSFIRDYPSKDPGTIALTIIQLAKNLDMKTVAEGIETEEQLSFLLENGCCEGQGYYFHAPLNPMETEGILISDLYRLEPGPKKR